jgi:ribosomal protein L37E
MVGKFKNNLNESCPDCGARKLQIRTVDVKNPLDRYSTTREEYICCSECGYEKKADKRKRRQSEE